MLHTSNENNLKPEARIIRNHLSSLIDSPPQIVLLTIYLHKNRVDLERITVSTMLPFEIPCVSSTELDTPVPDDFPAKRDATFRQ